jgi:hypothetical protein
MHKGRKAVFISLKLIWVNHIRGIIITYRSAVKCATPYKFLPYQLSMVVYWTTMAITGNGELGFDSGEGA